MSGCGCGPDWRKPKPNGTCATCGGWLPGEELFGLTALWGADDEIPCPAAGGIPCGSRACVEYGCEDQRDTPSRERA